MKARYATTLCLVGALAALPPLRLAGQTPPKFEAKHLQLGTVRTLHVEPPPEVQKRLTTKKKFDVKLLQQSITYRGRIPLLRLKSGNQVALLPLDEIVMPTVRERQQSELVIGSLSKYAPYYNHVLMDPNVIATILGNLVDHRACQTPIRDQLDRGTCTAFASVAGLEGFESCKNKITVNLSEQDAYHISMQQVSSSCRADVGVATYTTAQYLTQNCVCQENQMAYTNMAGLPANDGTHVPSGCQNAAPKYCFSDTQVVLGTKFGGPANQNANNTEFLESLLSAGYDIVYGLYVAGSDWNDGTAESGVVDVQNYNGSPAPAVGGHAMLLVGFDRRTNYFIFKNSWNASHGHAGYFYLSYDYIKTYGKYGYVVKGVVAK